MPLLLVLVMAVVTPSYFAPLLRSGIGLLMFGSMIVLLVAGALLVYLILRFDKRRVDRGG
jgi:Flp pilus assembly protein TadB